MWRAIDEDRSGSVDYAEFAVALFPDLEVPEQCRQSQIAPDPDNFRSSVATDLVSEVVDGEASTQPVLQAILAELQQISSVQAKHDAMLLTLQQQQKKQQQQQQQQHG